MKSELITEILSLKAEAISYDFDWPTQDPAEATTEALTAFCIEVKNFIQEAKDRNQTPIDFSKY